MSDLPKPRWRLERQPVVAVEQTPIRLTIPDSTDNENLLVHFTWDGYWVRGEVYPYGEPEGVIRFFHVDGDIDTSDRSQARMLFRFLYCWSNSWVSRVSFPEGADYWGEELRDLAKAWELLEPVLKVFVKKHDPDKPYVD